MGASAFGPSAAATLRGKADADGITAGKRWAKQFQTLLAVHALEARHRLSTALLHSLPRTHAPSPPARPPACSPGAALLPRVASCRICLDKSDVSDLETPCSCKGSMQVGLPRGAIAAACRCRPPCLATYLPSPHLPLLLYGPPCSTPTTRACSAG